MRKIFSATMFMNILVVIVCVFLLINTVNKISTYEISYKLIKSNQMDKVINNENTVFVLYYKESCIPCSALKETLNEIINEYNLKNIYAVDIEDEYFNDNKFVIIEYTPTFVKYENAIEKKRIEKNVSKNTLLKFLNVKTNKKK